MVKLQRVARRRTKDDIEELAWQMRGSMGLGPFDKVPVSAILEHVLPDLLPGYEFRVAEHGHLGAAEAVTDVAKPIITFDERVYDRLCRDSRRARMTGSHEIGHLLMHTGQTGMAFMRKQDRCLDLEWQADAFAEAFMMPECAFRKVASIEEAMDKFGVSRGAATYRARALKMPWLIEGKPAPRRAKRKGHDKRRTP